MSDSTNLDQIVAVLTGRKVLDPTTKTWHIFNVNGDEIADPGAVLLRGLHGWMLRAFQQLSAAVPLLARRRMRR